MHDLEALPFDILFEISKHLDLEDIAHLAQTCRQLRDLLDADGLTRRAVEANHAYSKEAQQARQGIITYREAFFAIYDRRHAFSNARPFSARIVGHGGSFLYRHGILCIMEHGRITIQNLRSGIPAIEVDIHSLLYSENPEMAGRWYKMLYYNEGILAVHVENSDGSNLVKFISTRNNLNNWERSLGHIATIPPGSKLFVRHTAEYVCCGTHTGQGTDGHRKWSIQTYRMDAVRKNIELGDNETNEIVLQNFHGDDIGSTVAFEVHDGHFYAVSNQNTYEVEEIDWTSFYHCIRIPLNDPVKEAMQRNNRVYRRQHRDGTIHDSWTDLVLQHDDKTNDLHIIESRREWLGSSTKHSRTFYATRIEFDAAEDSEYMDHTSDNQVVPRPLPANDCFTSLLPSSHHANWMPTPKQYSWTSHPEFPPTGRETSTARSFILARTKFRAYNFSSSAFLDLVEDAECCPTRSPSQLPCLRLRIGSRRIAPNPERPISNGKGKSAAIESLVSNNEDNGPTHFEDDTQYRYSPIHLWPPQRTDCPCSQRLHHIMNPPARTDPGLCSDKDTITAISDERSFVYMVKPGRSYADRSARGKGIDDRVGTIVLVDFGRPSTPALNASRSGEWRSEWAKDRQRCREGRC